MLPLPDTHIPARRHLVFAVLSLVFFLASPMAAEDGPLDTLQDEFRVIETRQGWALQPREDTDDYGLIEITEGQVLVDGREVDEEELRRYVDEAAAVIFDVAATVSDEERAAAEREEQINAERQERRRHRDSQVSFGSALVVERDEVVDEVVLLGGDLEVLGEVDGDATVILGSADIEGTVDGSLTVIGGTVVLRENSLIEGELVSVGGRVRRESGARVDGEVTQVAIGDIDLDGIDIDFGRPRLRFFDNSVLDIIGKLFSAGFVLCAIFLAFFLAPTRIRRISSRVQMEPWKAGAVGLIVEVLFAPLLLLVTVLLAISIVGIPLLVVVPPLLGLMLVVYFVLGIAGVSLWTGERMRERFDLKSPGPYLLLGIGLALIYGWSILGEVFEFTPWPVRITAFILLFLGFVLKYAAWTVGIGAAVLDQFSPVSSQEAWTPTDDREIASALPFAENESITDERDP